VKRNVPQGSLLTFRKERTLLHGPVQFATIGENETKNGLRHGLVSRDITRDIRIIEFCLGAPMECFSNHHGETRRIVRIGFADKFPPGSMVYTISRGRQSADWVARLQRRWDEIYPELTEKCLSDCMAGFVDREKVEKTLEDLRVLVEPELPEGIHRLIWLYYLALFVEKQRLNGVK